MARSGHARDGINRGLIRRQIARTVGKGACAFAEHVETGGKAVVFGFGHPRGGFVNRATHDEDFAHHLHCGTHRLTHEWLTRARNQAAQDARLAGFAYQRAANYQPPCCRIDQL